MGLLVLVAALSVRSAESAPYAAIVADARSGEILYQENANTRLHPASLTKMLTLYIAFDAVQRGEISLDTMVVVSKNAASKPPSRLGLRAGQRIALRHLIRAAAIRSANDAASAIGDALSGSEAAFSERMNRTARALGMKNSTFKNANGLTAPGHLSTAADMNHLGRRLFYDFPQYYNIFSRRSDDAGVARVNNTNNRFLAAYKGADGIKTGYTNAAGFNLTASAERGNKRIIATVFGGKSTAHRNAKMAELMDMGFQAAPRNAPTRKPAPADIPGDMVVAAAPDSTEAGSRAAGKTIRLITSVKSSIRPRPRPGKPVDPAQADAAAELVMAMQDSIAGALAMATEAPPAAPIAPDAAAEADMTVQRPEPAPTPLPFALVAAEDVSPAVETVQSAPEEATPVVVAEAAEAQQEIIISGPDLRPAPRPERMTASAKDATKVAQSEALPAEAVDAEALEVDAMEVVALAAPIASPDAPTPRMAAPPPPAPEVVTRISTSGGRHWGINLGRFPSRAAAERTLMRTALAENTTLRESLRKVVQRQGGFEANFMGLSQEQADLACRRLQARAITCFTLGP
jgi:D-alanyl-D-alanine carboxypeptidase